MTYDLAEVNFTGSSRYRDANIALRGLANPSFEVNNIRFADRSILEQMAESIRAQRDPLFGFRIANGDRIDQILEINDPKIDPLKLIALNDIYCKKYGKGDPLTFINELEALGGHADWGYNSRIEQMVKAAVMGRNPQLAAALILAAGEGPGVDGRIIGGILINSKDEMNAPTHALFVARIAEAFKQISGGETLDDFIIKEHSSSIAYGITGGLTGAAAGFGAGVAAGAIAGMGAFSIPAAAIGGLIGAVSGFAAGFLPAHNGWFGTDETGKEYFRILDESRKNTHNVGYNMGFGGMPSLQGLF